MSWYLQDRLGSVREIVNNSGSVIDAIVYDAFGKVVSESSPSNGDRIKFQGMWWVTTTGVYHAGNSPGRDYNPETGRWMQMDIGWWDGPNLYQFVGNSPTNYVDPTGKYLVSLKENKASLEEVKRRLAGPPLGIRSEIVELPSRSWLGSPRYALVSRDRKRVEEVLKGTPSEKSPEGKDYDWQRNVMKALLNGEAYQLEVVKTAEQFRVLNGTNQLITEAEKKAIESAMAFYPQWEEHDDKQFKESLAYAVWLAQQGYLHQDQKPPESPPRTVIEALPGTAESIAGQHDRERIRENDLRRRGWSDGLIFLERTTAPYREGNVWQVLESGVSSAAKRRNMTPAERLSKLAEIDRMRHGQDPSRLPTYPGSPSDRRGAAIFDPCLVPGSGITDPSRLLPPASPVVIEFPVKKGYFNTVQRKAFIEHLAEQESQLNSLSATDLRQNLDNYANINKLNMVDRSRRLAGQYLGTKPTAEYDGQTFDAAHRLDSVAGGYIHDFAGWRDSKAQQLIGSLWRDRRNLIRPGREHRLVPRFEE